MNRALRLALMLVLAASWVQPRQTQAQQPDPSTPSKEYIYLGGRLIATEEGQGLVVQRHPDLSPMNISLSPNSAVPGASFTLTITGTNLTGTGTTAVAFSPSVGITVTPAGTDSSTSLTRNVTVPNTVPEGSYLVTVTTSNGTGSAAFSVVPPSGPITISSDTSTIQAGNTFSATVTLTAINGSVFTTGSTVWKSSQLYAQQGTPGFKFFPSTNQIQFQVPPTDTATPGTLEFTVHTPVSGTAENISNTITINVVLPGGGPNPRATFNSMSVTSVNAGCCSQGFDLTVFNSNPCTVVGSPLFGVNNNSLILINGSARSTQFNGTAACSVTTHINAIDVANPGALSVQVFNPAPCELRWPDGLPLCGLSFNTLWLQVNSTTQGVFSINLPAGNSSWLKVAHNQGASINITASLTVEAWILPSRNDAPQGIVQKFDPAQPTTNGGYGLRLNSGGTVSFSTYQTSLDSDTITSRATVLVDGLWHHVAGVLDSGQFRIYIDGVQDLNATSSCGACRSPGNNDLVNLLIGASPDAGGFFIGNLDEIRVSNGAVYPPGNFTPAKSLPPGTGAGLWKFDDQTFNDYSGGNDGVAKGGSIFFSSNTPISGSGSNVGSDVGGGNLPALTGFIGKESATQGDGSSTIKVAGTNLSSGLTFSQAIDASGTAVPGISVTSTSSSCQGTDCQVTANIQVNALTAPGAYLVAAPGSDPLVFTVNGVAASPLPSLSGASLSPAFVPVGATPLPNIKIFNGTNLTSNSVVRVNGSDRVTTPPAADGSISFTLSQADLEIPSPPALNITVFNPPSAYKSPGQTNGGESTTSLPLTVTQTNNPQPNLISACVVPVGTTSCVTTIQNGIAGTLKAFGSGNSFIGASQIVYHGQARTAQLINANELDISLTSADTANNTGQTLNVPVQVNTPSPGGGLGPIPPLTIAITGPNPIPTITNLTVGGAAPHIIAGGTTNITLQVMGTGFVGTTTQAVSYVNVNGQSRQTTTHYVNATELDVTITPADISSPGQLEITVFSPTPGGGTSDPMLLTVLPASNPKPTATNITSPARVQVDTVSNPPNSTQVNLVGSGFITGISQALVNGFPRITTVSDSTHLSVTMLDSDFAVLGQLQIRVSNPEPGGGVSDASLPLPVFAPTPTLNPNGISPTSAIAGPNPVTLTLNGTNFIDESTVLVNGVSRAAAVVPNTGNTQLQVTLTADVATGGTLGLQVSNPTTGGGGGTTTPAVNYTVNNPLLALDQTTPLTPATILAGTGNQTISVFGTGFVPPPVGGGSGGTTVTINSTNRATYVDPNHLNVSILASDIQSGRQITITAVNPTPGGGSSGPATLTVNNPVPAIDPNNPFNPPIVLVGSGSQDIIVQGTGAPGTGFVPNPNGSSVTVNQQSRTAVWQDSNHLKVSLQSADLLNPVGTLTVTVVNPIPGGGTSTQSLPLNNPVPTLSGLSRVAAYQGDPSFTLNVLGTNLVSNATVTFNPGNISYRALPSSTPPGSVSIQVDSVVLNTVTTYTVTVSNPTPGGGTSQGSASFQVFAPPANPPTVSSISPTVVTIGANPTPPLTVNGSNFIVPPASPTSVVVINGAAHNPANTSTCTNSATKLCISLSGDDVSAPAGTYPVTVANPPATQGAPPVVSNNNVVLTLANPSMGSLSPSSATTNMSPPLPQLVIQLTGGGSSFVITTDPNTSATAQINGGAVHQAVVAQSDSAHLVIQLLPADVAASGRYTVTWKNPGGGPTAVNQAFAVFDAPRVDSLSPNSGTIPTQSPFTPPSFTVNGANFTDPNTPPINLNPVLVFNGAAHIPTNTAATTLSITLTSDDMNAGAGVYPVTVVTTTPGGVSNNNVTFTLNNPQIGMGSLSSSSVLAGSGPQTLTVRGTGFVRATTVTINGQSRATYVSPTQLNVSILASETTTAGTIPITAVNAPPGGGSGTLTFTINNPTPAISSLSPASATTGGAAFTLTVNGSNFVSGAIVQVNGSSRTTTFVSATQLTASIPASDIASAGTLSITVANPAPSAGASAAATFTVNNVVPTISSLSPTSATVGGAAFTLTVNGTNFVSGATVKVNGNSRTMTFVSATQLTASIPAGDIASAGTLSVTVVNPTPGGGTSAAATFTVNNPAPTISSLSPNSATAGGAAFTLTVNGTNFVSGATVKVNGNSRTTTFVSATQLTASIPASDIASAGTLSVTVVNPTPGGGASGAASFTVNSAVPVISGLSPQSVAAGGPDFTLTITGSNFINGATVQVSDLNGTLSGTRSATFISSTQLTVQMFASDIASADTIYFQVVTSSNSGAGGTSNTAAMSVH